MASKTIIDNIPEEVEVSHHNDQGCFGAFLTFPEKLLKKGYVSDIKLQDMTEFLAIERYRPWWVRPAFGKVESAIPKETQYLLWRRSDGMYGIILPLIENDIRATIEGEADGFRVVFDGAHGVFPKKAVMLFAGLGEDPYALTRWAVTAVADVLKTFHLRIEKNVPAFVDYVGWCTWDAFYTEVDEEKVLAGLQSFKKAGFVPPFLILDDGWQDTVERYLNDFTPNKKFPKGLEPLIKKAKEKYGVKIFGVWHALVGYWNGVHPASPLMKRYRTVTSENQQVIFDQKPTQRHMVHPDDIYRFYQEWYADLRQQGVDMVKVDNQSSLETFSLGQMARVSTMKNYQYALQGAAEVHFGGNLLHCMSNGSDVAYHMSAGNVWRNSDDFYPNAPDSHAFHIHTNAMNNMWSSHFCIPDWDMFQTTHHAGAFHAASRAISGGPVYVSDKATGHDIDLLKKMCTSDGRVLRCDQPALPSADRLFIDCYREPRLMKITNTNGPIGVLGLFHCYYTSEGTPVVQDSFTPNDVPYLEGTSFAVYHHQSKTLEVMKRNQARKLTLKPLEFELLTISPIKDAVAPLGLLNKMNGSRAFEWFEMSAGVFQAQVRDGGPIGFYAETAPKEIRINGKKSKGTYSKKTKLLTITAPEGAELELLLSWRIQKSEK